MADFDLIPASYRQRQRLRLATLAVAVVYAATLALGGAGLGRVRGELGQLQSETSRARAGRMLTDNLLGEIEAARAARDHDGGLLSTLAQLRTGLAAHALFVVIDGALNDGIWLRRWAYGRSAHEGPEATASATVAGTIGVAVQAHLEITGAARSHADLGRFVDGLLDAAPVTDVRVVHSALRPAEGVVEFALEVALDTDGAGGAR
ncbi:MAG: hypothetical protein AB7Q81_20695 [Gammaproteobacteria bacterium]